MAGNTLYNEKVTLSVGFIEMLEETSILSFRFFFLSVYLSGQSVHENIAYPNSLRDNS